jgi:hypothetical protein
MEPSTRASARGAGLRLRNAPGPGRCSRRAATSTSSAWPSPPTAPAARGLSWTSCRPTRRPSGLQGRPRPRASCACRTRSARRSPPSRASPPRAPAPTPRPRSSRSRPLGPTSPRLRRLRALAESLPPGAEVPLEGGGPLPPLVRASRGRCSRPPPHGRGPSRAGRRPSPLPRRLARRRHLRPNRPRPLRRGGRGDARPPRRVAGAGHRPPSLRVQLRARAAGVERRDDPSGRASLGGAAGRALARHPARVGRGVAG